MPRVFDPGRALEAWMQTDSHHQIRPSDGCARYIGRLGVLAVALGIGAAVSSSFGMGVALADGTGTGPGENSASVDASPPSSASPPPPASAGEVTQQAPALGSGSPDPAAPKHDTSDNKMEVD